MMIVGDFQSARDMMDKRAVYVTRLEQINTTVLFIERF